MYDQGYSQVSLLHQELLKSRECFPSTFFVLLNIGMLQAWRFSDWRKMRFMTNERVGMYNHLLEALRPDVDIFLDWHELTSSCLLDTPDGIHYHEAVYIEAADMILSGLGTLTKR